jgi:hypothetical protein
MTLKRMDNVLIVVDDPGARIGIRYDGEDPRRSALDLESSELARKGG